MFQYWLLSVISVQVSLVIISYQCSGVSTGHYQLSAFRTGILSSQVPSTLASPSCSPPPEPKNQPVTFHPPRCFPPGCLQPSSQTACKMHSKKNIIFQSILDPTNDPKGSPDASQINPKIIKKKTTSGCRSVFDIDFGCILEGPKPGFQRSRLHDTRFLTFYAGHENSSKWAPRSI